MHYSTTGNGQAILLIHGFGEDSRIWNTVLPALLPMGKLIVPDLPGTGQSATVSELNMEILADGIAEILKLEKIEKAVLIGHSMGGYISLAFAEKYPEKMQAIALVHSTAFADSEPKIQARTKSIDFIKEHGTATYLSSTTPNLFAPANRGAFESTIQHLISENTYISAASLIAFLHAMIQRKDTTHVLRSSKVPVLFIVGKDDQAVLFSDTMQQVYLPDLSYIHILRQSGHMGMLEEPEKFCKALIQFLACIQ